MRYLGIDYGSKRIGLALSDESGTFAMPYSVIPTNKKTVNEIIKICKDQNIGTIVLGESKNFKGEKNLIMKEIEVFKKELENIIETPVILEPEFMTSAEATHIQGSHDKLDASAAALILKSFLDKKNSSS